MNPKLLRRILFTISFVVGFDVDQNVMLCMMGIVENSIYNGPNFGASVSVRRNFVSDLFFLFDSHLKRLHVSSRTVSVSVFARRHQISEDTEKECLLASQQCRTVGFGFLLSAARTRSVLLSERVLLYYAVAEGRQASVHTTNI